MCPISWPTSACGGIVPGSRRAGTVVTVRLHVAEGAPPYHEGAIGSGVTRIYTGFYRNAAAAFCPPATFNGSNGIRIVW